MKAGKEMDLLVTEKVMGYCFECIITSEKHKKNDPETIRLIKEKARYGAMVYIGEETDLDESDERVWYCGLHDKRLRPREIKAYSTDIKAAWEVVERMMKSGDWKCVIWSNGGNYSAQFQRHKEGSMAMVDTSDDAPEAICRAALKAITHG